MNEPRSENPSRAQLFARLEELKGRSRTGLLRVGFAQGRLKEKVSDYGAIRNEVHELHDVARVRGQLDEERAWTLALLESGLPPDKIQEIWNKRDQIMEKMKQDEVGGQENQPQQVLIMSPLAN